jgi:hypothetical protein
MYFPFGACPDAWVSVYFSAASAVCGLACEFRQELPPSEKSLHRPKCESKGCECEIERSPLKLNNWDFQHCVFLRD